MKIIIDLIKIALLSCIAIFLGMNFATTKKNATPAIEEINNSSKKVELGDSEKNLAIRKKDLRKILEHSLVQIFTYPESVKIINAKFTYNRLNDYGVKVVPEKEVEFATLCGQYTAPTAMALNSAAQPFYGEIGVDNEKKLLKGSFGL